MQVSLKLSAYDFAMEMAKAVMKGIDVLIFRIEVVTRNIKDVVIVNSLRQELDELAQEVNDIKKSSKELIENYQASTDDFSKEITVKLQNLQQCIQELNKLKEKEEVLLQQQAMVTSAQQEVEQTNNYLKETLKKHKTTEAIEVDSINIQAATLEHGVYAKEVEIIGSEPLS